MAVARNRPFNSCKIEDNEGLRSFVYPSLSFAPVSSFPRSPFIPALFLSRPCLPEPNPAPRSRVQRRSLHRSVINHRRVGLTQLHAREPARARRELLSFPCFFFFVFFPLLFFLHFVTRRRKKRADGAKKIAESCNRRFRIRVRIFRSIFLLITGRHSILLLC